MGCADGACGVQSEMVGWSERRLGSALQRRGRAGSSAMKCWRGRALGSIKQPLRALLLAMWLLARLGVCHRCGCAHA
eukprot:353304-Chlamydomonas_euryale.AAC.6